MAKVLYVCDPKKNKDCPKTGCAYNEKAKYHHCKATADYSLAKYDNNGNPIIDAVIEEDKKHHVIKVFTYLET